MEAEVDTMPQTQISQQPASLLLSAVIATITGGGGAAVINHLEDARLEDRLRQIERDIQEIHRGKDLMEYKIQQLQGGKCQFGEFPAFPAYPKESKLLVSD